MYSFLYKFCSWLLQKLSAGVLIVVLGVASVAGWIYLRETVDFDRSRAALVQSLSDERDQLQSLRAEMETSLALLQSDIIKEEQRVQQAAKVISTLRALESWWDRFIGNPEQQRANAEQIKRMEAVSATATGQLADLQRKLLQTTWERDGLDVALSRAQRRLQGEELSQSRILHYGRRAWDQAKLYVIVALAVFLFGPSLLKVALYYGLAPLLARSRPIRLAESVVAQPGVGESHVSVDSALWPGEVLLVKEKYLQSSDEGLSKKTRFLLDWRIPFTSIACGLSELVAMRNGMAVGERNVTFSSSDDPHMELSILAVPEGGSLILRPSFLAGVIMAADRPLRIRPRWQLFRWQAWITLQFRFFEFHGPCRLLVAGSRGVRAEHLIERGGRVPPARRTNQMATIGFTPSLDYRPVRAETFWGYYRGMNPLFDDLFSGQGVFIVQETVAAGAAEKPGQFWSTIWSGILKVFGI